MYMLEFGFNIHVLNFIVEFQLANLTLIIIFLVLPTHPAYLVFFW